MRDDAAPADGIVTTDETALADGTATTDGTAMTDGGHADPTAGSPTRSSGGYRDLFRMMAKKRYVLLVRYPVNTLSMVGTIFIFFTLIFFGGRALDQQALTDSLEGLIVGFFLYTLSITAFSGLSWAVQRESQWGTLEQLYMSPFGFGRVMLADLATRVAESFLWAGATLAFMLALTGASIHLPVATILVVGVFALAPAAGIGFVFGGLAMIYKRVENVFQLMNWGFIGLIAAPTSDVFLLRLLPVSQGSYVLTRVMSEGLRLWEIPAEELALLVGSGVVYFGIGYATFLWASRHARRRGLMGDY